MHPADIKAMLAKKGYNQNRVASEIGVGKQAVSFAINSTANYARIKSEIAKIIGVEPSKIWPQTIFDRDRND